MIQRPRCWRWCWCALRSQPENMPVCSAASLLSLAACRGGQRCLQPWAGACLGRCTASARDIAAGWGRCWGRTLLGTHIAHRWGTTHAALPFSGWACPVARPPTRACWLSLALLRAPLAPGSALRGACGRGHCKSPLLTVQRLPTGPIPAPVQRPGGELPTRATPGRRDETVLQCHPVVRANHGFRRDARSRSQKRVLQLPVAGAHSPCCPHPVSVVLRSVSTASQSCFEMCQARVQDVLAHMVLSHTNASSPGR